MAIVQEGEDGAADRKPISKPARILVVEDDQASRRLVTAILELEGYDVEVATTAAQASRLIIERGPDLILMDVQLPGEDGLSFTRRLKADPLTAGIPIVAVTALVTSGDRERTIAAGCDGYLAKPVDTRTFASDIRRFLRSTA